MFRSSARATASSFATRTTSTTMFTKNVAGGSTPTGVLDADLRVLYVELAGLSKLYAAGDFPALKERLTNQKFSSLSISLGRLRSANTEYEMIRSASLSFLQGLQRASVQNIELEDVKTSYIVVKERAGILDDMDRLTEFLNDLNTKANTSVLGDYSVTASVSAVIAPQYLLYIGEYGFPPDGVFDPAKLASINIRASLA